jgi:hypothetical protein
MRESKQLDAPLAKRSEKSIVQSDAEARSARKTTSKTPPKQVAPPRQTIEESSTSVELAAGKTPFLLVLPISNGVIPMDYFLTYLTTATLSPAAKAFIEVLNHALATAKTRQSALIT